MKWLRVRRQSGYLARPVLRREIEEAQSKTRSGAEAARYLGISYNTYKKYAVMYDLFERHKNPSGAGIPKTGIKGRKYPLDEILDGKYPSYNTRLLKERLLKSGYFDEKCMICGFGERRITDYKVPLMLVFKDGDKTNHHRDNILLLCFNCAYLTAGELNRVNPMKVMQDSQNDKQTVISGEDKISLTPDEVNQLIEEAKEEMEDE